MSDKFLVVYNTCEIRGNNLFWYVDCIKNLLAQDYPNFHVAISGCRNTEATKRGLSHVFGNKISYNFIDDIYTVNITFNHTVKKMVENHGTYDGYIYVDSGMNVQHQKNILSEIYTRSKTKQYGIVTVQSSTDTGYEGWFGKTETYTYTGEDFIVPVGRACNLHFQYFSNELFLNYNNILPDIFAAHCTESTFSFLTAALGLKWIIIKDFNVFHAKATDGPSSGFNHVGSKGRGWNNLLFDLDINDILVTKEGKDLGMGYEEIQGIMNHDPTKYTSDGIAKEPGLKNFIKKSLFLPPQLFDYTKIKSEFIL